MKKKFFWITSILTTLLMLTIIIIESTFIGLNNWKNKVDEPENFSYVQTQKYEFSELIDVEKSFALFSIDDIQNFNSSMMNIVNTTYGNREGLSTTVFNPLLIKENGIGNLSNTSYLAPYYDQEGNIYSFISGSKDFNGNDRILNWGKKGSNFNEYDLKNYDHEMFRYKDKDYILNGSNIWVNNESEQTKFTYNSSQGLSLPPTKDENDEHVSTVAGYHFNSFDIYGENLLINSRDFGTIFSLHILNEDGTLKSEDEFEVNWVLCGNSITPWYIDPYYNEDGTWENPIIYNGNEEEVTYWNYDHNESYTPHVFDEWEDKLLKIDIDGTVYDFTDIEQAKAFNLLSNDNKFWGAHTVRVINTYLDSVASTIPEYNPDNLYISIHDNHFPSDVVFKYLDSDMHAVDWGDDPYSFHAYEDSTKALFGDNPYSLENDKKSFTKIYEINTDTMTAKQVLNRDNTVSDNIDQFSDYRSSSTFFSINGQSYLITESSMNSSFALVAFDGIDFDKQELVNERVIMDVQWKGEAGGYIHYRTYPIFADISNVAYGWNVLNTNPYMG